LITAGESHAYDDPVALRWHKLAYEGFIEPEVAGPVWFMPWLAKIAPDRTGFSNLVIAVNDLRNEFREFIRPRQEAPDHAPTNFIDFYLQEIRETTDPASSFYKDTGIMNLIDLLINLFSAGSDTTSATLGWGFVYLLNYPDIYRKWKEELTQVCGPGNFPTLADKANLPYTEATIHELLRITSITSGALLHSTTDDIQFESFNLPKGTIVLPNLFHCQHDEKYWGDPEEFKPERWLSNGVFKKDEHSIPFSVGKRICPAEHLALLNLFIIFTGLIQTFDFTPCPNEPLPTLDPKPGLVLHPTPYKMILKLRK